MTRPPSRDESLEVPETGLGGCLVQWEQYSYYFMLVLHTCPDLLHGNNIIPSATL